MLLFSEVSFYRHEQKGTSVGKFSLFIQSNHKAINTNRSLEAGFSLIQVIVALSLSSLIGVGIFQAINSAIITQKRVADMNSYDDFLVEMRSSLRQTDQCTALFREIPITTTGDIINQAQALAIPETREIPSIADSTGASFRYGSLSYGNEVRAEVAQAVSTTEVIARIFFLPLDQQSGEVSTVIRPRPLFASFRTATPNGPIVSCTGIDSPDQPPIVVADPPDLPAFDPNANGVSKVRFTAPLNVGETECTANETDLYTTTPARNIANLPAGSYEVDVKALLGSKAKILGDGSQSFYDPYNRIELVVDGQPVATIDRAYNLHGSLIAITDGGGHMQATPMVNKNGTTSFTVEEGGARSIQYRLHGRCHSAEDPFEGYIEGDISKVNYIQ